VREGIKRRGLAPLADVAGVSDALGHVRLAREHVRNLRPALSRWAALCADRPPVCDQCLDLAPGLFPDSSEDRQERASRDACASSSRFLLKNQGARSEENNQANQENDADDPEQDFHESTSDEF
jgi:hypothetical protein